MNGISEALDLMCVELASVMDPMFHGFPNGRPCPATLDEPLPCTCDLVDEIRAAGHRRVPPSIRQALNRDHEHKIGG